MDYTHFMQMAIDEADLSPEGGARVGAVAVSAAGELIVQAHKGEDGASKHAEEVLIDKAVADGKTLSSATVFVTLEPCANLEGKRTSCADRLIEAGVSQVFIGRYDLNFRINRQGWKRLVEAGIECKDFTQDLRNRVDSQNEAFAKHFLGRTGPLTGTARFDWTTNSGRYELSTGESDGRRTWITQWTTRGADSIYAYGGKPGVVALARYATEFDQIDDPGAYDFGSSSAELEVGDIAIYRNEHGYALVKVLTVEAPQPYGDTPHVSLKFSYELRPTDVQVK